jgi:hypothetical protein
LALAAALSGAAAQAEPSSPLDEIIVRGRSYAELREQIRIREQAVYTRFNEINSDDGFDIHCTMERRRESHILERRCLSNSWREQDSNMGQAYLGAAAGRPGIGVAEYFAEQRRMQALLKEEMRRLSFEDAALGEAVLDLGQAMQALQLRRGGKPSYTMFREVSTDADEPLLNAERIFEVQIGVASWTHYLRYPTFTLGAVTGKVRSVDVDCEQGRHKIDYEPEVEWTLPQSWSRCLLLVRAKRGSKFTFYEFQ